MDTNDLVIVLQELSKLIVRLQDTADRLETAAKVNDDRISKIMNQLNMIEDAIVNDDSNDKE